MEKRNIWMSLFLLALALVTGCSAPALATPTPTEELAAPSQTSTLPPTHTPLPTETATLTPLPTYTPTLPPSPTATAIDTETPTPTASPTSPLPQASGAFVAASGDTVKIYFIRLKTGGSAGCGDSLIAVSSGVKISGDVAEDVAAGLERLFAVRDKFLGDLYNPLAASNIRVEKVDFERTNGLITVYLRGTYKPSGDACDHTRVKAQVWSTVRQFRAVKLTNIYLNGIPFGDRVSNDK